METEGLDPAEPALAREVEANGTPGRLAPATLIGGGKYRLGPLRRHGVFGEVYAATVVASGTSVSVGVLAPDLAVELANASRVQDELATATRLDHKNITRTLDAGVDHDLVYFVTEDVDGPSLYDLLARKRELGKAAFSLRGANSIIAHVCNALTYAHATTMHGALSSANVLVDRAGRVKLTEFGLARLIPAMARLGSALRPGDLAALAPELVTAPEAAGARADIYSTGAILFELLTGRTPSESLIRVSSIVGGMPLEVDRVIERCLAPNPRDRFADAAELKSALAEVVAVGPTTANADDLPVAEDRPDREGKKTHADAAPTSVEVAPHGDLALDDHEARWLVTRGLLDCGPFSAHQVRTQIENGELRAGSAIVDHESGERVLVEDHPLFQSSLALIHQRARDVDRERRDVAVTREEKRNGALLLVTIACGLAALAAAGVVGVRKLRDGQRGQSSAHLASLDRAELPITIDMTPAPEGTAERRHRRPASAEVSADRASPAAATPDDAEFAASLDMGSVDGEDTDSPGDPGQDEERLDNTALNRVIQEHSGDLGHCLRTTGTHRARIDFVVRGSGRVSAVRVNGDTASPLSSCIRSAMQSFQFPPFKGARTRASFEMAM